ncbi:20030_t:CDS:2, partial [Gigaspora rosea]
IAYVLPIIAAGHHVWVHNKLAPGTRARVDPSETPDFAIVIDEEESTAHKGFSLWVHEDSGLMKPLKRLNFAVHTIILKITVGIFMKDPPGLSWLKTKEGIRKSTNRLDYILWLTENGKQQ